MQIIENQMNFQIDDETVVSIGKFDGVHRGHLKILEAMQEYKSRGMKLAIFTFSTPPASVFFKKQTDVLTTKEEKRAIFETIGIDYLVEFPFDTKTAAITAEKFVEFLVKQMNMKACVVGTDCRFGYRGQGNCKMLKEMSKEYQYDIRVIEKLVYNNHEISSTYIREAVETGNIPLANDMMSRPYEVSGVVVHGKQLGRTIGMPTVNLLPSSDKILPPNGVYFSEVVHDGRVYSSITNIGQKPTVSPNEKVMGVESYLYDFSEDFYGEKIKVLLYEYVRSEMKFPSIEALKTQMERDISKGALWHKKRT